MKHLVSSLASQRLRGNAVSSYKVNTGIQITTYVPWVPWTIHDQVPFATLAIFTKTTNVDRLSRLVL